MEGAAGCQGFLGAFSDQKGPDGAKSPIQLHKTVIRSGWQRRPRPTRFRENSLGKGVRPHAIDFLCLFSANLGKKLFFRHFLSHHLFGTFYRTIYLALFEISKFSALGTVLGWLVLFIISKLPALRVIFSVYDFAQNSNQDKSKSLTPPSDQIELEIRGGQSHSIKILQIWLCVTTYFT